MNSPVQVVHQLDSMTRSKDVVLVVEDNRAMRHGLARTLEQRGYGVRTAANGKEALAEMRDERPSLIVSDIAMPVMDGIEFFEAVRKQGEWVTIPFIFLTARSTHEDRLLGRGLGAEDYLVKPIRNDEFLTAVRSRLRRARQLRTVQLQQSYEATLTVLANAIELRDDYTRGHVERVTSYALAIAHELALTPAQREELRFSGILHDIGKIYVSETTLNTTGPLSDEQFDEIRQHPADGATLIKDIPFLAPCAPTIRHHHEYWDGSGYPDGLAGARIPDGARIISVADSFDAMTSNRPYHTARSQAAAFDEIVACAGRQFDPEVVAAFRSAWTAQRIQPIHAAIAQVLGH